ncbi:amino acid ABC transporter permease [Rhodoplanes sp. TEM]|uniref:Amino acid ABC transporter permease n=1 Tax=Rhodoplanes tepidamans TaxID=200616 RepID=A0ABT5JGH4_RHOTP|nr:MULTISPECIES: amino acid ABC transporter permease [Rhodoplanes]MDC7788389.1 amino acid ABC transporter permease [Rhodoplanes tepidamans]MDC7985330.1 amino acid ABC transporter permease [Rhodoplanes sp. TEM]MDQ0357112.1 His/Glu/Gln/Arg/opine family amino acid ABC transporter permease subunit [Rhodoplanes tepidamans]
MSYQFDWSQVWQHRDLILDGLLVTIALSVAALVPTLIVGMLIGTLGASTSRAGRVAAGLYVETMRNVPLLIHMYVWYMALAFLRLPAFLCAVLGLTLYSSAYVAELVRAGIAAVPRGQARAAAASGLRPWQVQVLVVYPQALRIVAPSLASLASQLVKDSSLASVIAVAELSYQAGAIEGQTFRTFEVYITIAVLYIALVLLISFAIDHVPGLRARRPIARIADA